MMRVLALFVLTLGLFGCQAVGPGVNIPPRTQLVLAVQSSQAKLCAGLARYLASLPEDRVTAKEKDEAGHLYDNAVLDNDSVINQLQLQLAPAGVKELVVDETLAKPAITSLVAFREYAEKVCALSKTSPVDPDAVLKGTGATRDGGVIVGEVVLGALRAAEWWYDQNKRAREDLTTKLEAFRLKPWHEQTAASAN